MRQKRVGESDILEHEEVIYRARIRLLENDNLLLKQKINEKNREIKLLERSIRKLKLKIPRKITEIQLSLDEFI